MEFDKEKKMMYYIKHRDKRTKTKAAGVPALNVAIQLCTLVHSSKVKPVVQPS